MKKYTLAAMLAFLIIACAPVTSRTTLRTEFKTHPDKVYAAAVRVTTRNGWGLQPRDSQVRVVDTQWIRLTEARLYRVSYSIIISKNDFEILIHCSAAGNPGILCAVADTPVVAVEMQQRLAKDIIDDLQRL